MSYWWRGFLWCFFKEDIMNKIIISLIVMALLSPAASFAKGGHYPGGHGSSHKGGKYHNPRTGDHYEKRH
ncbi:hypothetical protein E4659_11055 [Dickeya dianthicola]|nr:hypothetical protein [Dickeya dianthicola]MBI0449969.1 hypothetical protein [Dickeya dianthicola]MBI0454581.1 hypothetical protein [Dickeya dianthicola]MBI0458710.1 hypothetical protein [Dickeya dianthicola]MBI0463466.1 hypothetical protein [Dickeya dianthicola]